MDGRAGTYDRICECCERRPTILRATSDSRSCPSVSARTALRARIVLTGLVRYAGNRMNPFRRLRFGKCPATRVGFTDGVKPRGVLEADWCANKFNQHEERAEEEDESSYR